jgi:5-methylcytosine-specific restriction enzyme subunit McrC
LRAHLPERFSLQIQSHFTIADNNDLRFIIDLVLTDVQSGETICVLDTKYKRPQAPAQSDIEQAIAYAVAKGSREAILVYPVEIDRPLDADIGGIHVRSMTFSLEDDLEAAGNQFLDAVFG